MTWVLGSGVPFGYGALISDVRVSWPDGRRLDRLQKIYPVGAGLMAGFAGSVWVGFWMLAAMQRQWGADAGTLYQVPYMAWHWHRFARWFYRERIPHAAKAFGCELMITGVSPIRHPFGFYSHAVSMRAPDFVPNFVKPDGTWGSIGSGAQHNWAPHFGDNNAFMSVFAHGEVMNPGGAATMVAHSVADSVEREPMGSVSPIIQVGIVRAATHEIKILRRQHHGAWTVAQEEDVQAGELLRGWNEFHAAACAAGLDLRQP